MGNFYTKLYDIRNTHNFFKWILIYSGIFFIWFLDKSSILSFNPIYPEKDVNKFFGK